MNLLDKLKLKNDYCQCSYKLNAPKRLYKGHGSDKRARDHEDSCIFWQCINHLNRCLDVTDS